MHKTKIIQKRTRSEWFTAFCLLIQKLPTHSFCFTWRKQKFIEIKDDSKIKRQQNTDRHIPVHFTYAIFPTTPPPRSHWDYLKIIFFCYMSIYIIPLSFLNSTSLGFNCVYMIFQFWDSTCLATAWLINYIDTKAKCRHLPSVQYGILYKKNRVGIHDTAQKNVISFLTKVYVVCHWILFRRFLSIVHLPYPSVFLTNLPQI